ncbi:Peptidyl-prolyl cis-trans isomerase cyp15 [Grifola frondosa]|uniref:peptidylprolyl isomerase n=1 Tax=Grifola frondosa TaxID=5627 RepID=A0A1C7M8Y9_GRIFR|nr:Peptidyl-prolyl cis-trans isomerase cyp15 [Grifola frondosa]
MSDSDQDTSVLGKWLRNGQNTAEDQDATLPDVKTTQQVDADEDEDEDIGSMPMPAEAPGVAKKKCKVYLDHLPSTDRYSKSFMHQDVVNFCIMTKTDFLLTTSVDGHLKLWKKQNQGIEFVKHYRAHLAPIIAVSASADGQLFASVAEDGSAKVFDVMNFSAVLPSKSTLTCITLSPDSSSFVTFSLPDCQICIFSFLMQQASTAVYKVEDMEFGCQLVAERELELPGPDGRTLGMWINAIWDKSGAFVLYPTLLGIKVINTVTNRATSGQRQDSTMVEFDAISGSSCEERSNDCAVASANPLLAEKSVWDPTLVCTGYKRQRFYMFTRMEPEDDKSGDRDIFNECLTHEEQTVASSAPALMGAPSPLANAATIHTMFGDMHLRLFPQQAPKAVENFVGHARSGYYEGVIFHCVIPKFMIQTGDPLGNGTGGTSIWGRKFEDEFSDDLKHDRPYTVSMANVGPNTNGSQFFITTNATPWLDKKHTIFGHVLSELEVVHAIENVKTNKMDKPFDDIKIVNIDVE